MRGEQYSKGLFRFGVFTQPGSQAEGREFRTKGSFPFRSGGAHVRFKGPDGWATAVSGAAAQDLPDMLAVRPALWKGMRMCCFYIWGGHRFSYSRVGYLFGGGGRRTNLFHKTASPGACCQRFAEILRFMGYLAVPEFHYAYCVERLLVVIDDVFGDPQTAGPQNAPDFEALFARLQCAACLNVGAPANALPRLRIVKNGIVAINLMLRGTIRLRRKAAQCSVSAARMSCSNADACISPSFAGTRGCSRSICRLRQHCSRQSNPQRCPGGASSISKMPNGAVEFHVSRTSPYSQCQRREPQRCYGLCGWTGFISPRRVGMSSDTVG